MTEENNQQPAQPQPQKIMVSTSKESLIGKYTNQIVIGFSEEEFQMDVYFIKPPAGVLLDRLILSPTHAKRLADVIGQKIQEYEAKYKTKVKVTKQPKQEFGFALKNNNRFFCFTAQLYFGRFFC